MAQVGTNRKLKRQASSDIEEGPVKQARTSVQNAYICRYPPLRRSDSQALDINETTAVVEHLPHACEPVSVPHGFQHRPREDEDKAGSTDEESQDEDASWDRHAKARRPNMLFTRPHEPAAKATRARPALLIRTASEVALMDSDSEDEQPLASINPYGTGEAAAGKVQQLMALRLARAAAPKQPKASAVPVAIGAPAPSNTVATTSQQTRSLTSSEPSQPQNTPVRRSALEATAGHCSTTVSSPLVTPAPALSKTSSLSSVPSQIVRRSTRLAAKQQTQL
ncbi:hypothetical protein RSAG8_05878, partial [Rhizoctonia solani AG-8 WAC10335]